MQHLVEMVGYDMARILIVDDGYDEWQSLKSSLMEPDCEVILTTNCAFGLDVMNRQQLDLILFNINFTTDGFEFVRTVPDAIKGRLLVISTQNCLAPLQMLEQLARCNGVMGALKKPVSTTQILQILNMSISESK